MNFKDLVKDKLVIIVAFLIGVPILVFLVSKLWYVVFNSRAKDYAQLEEKLVDAAKDYYQDREDELPMDYDTTVTVTSDILFDANYIKEFSKITPNGDTCTGEVIVTKGVIDYIYTPNVSCDNYSTTYLSDYVVNNSEIVISGNGLYEDNGDYVYRGEFVDNYIRFAGRIYRIVSLNSDGTITIIADELVDDELIDDVSWDDRYNIDTEYNDGINDFGVSRVRDTLNEYLNGEYFSDEDRNLLSYYSVCVGKVGKNDGFTRNMECSDILDDQLIGLLPISNFNYASVDENCDSVINSSCQNYNYLADYVSNWWTVTGDNSTSYNVYEIGSYGFVNLNSCEDSSSIREVLNLNSKIVYIDGDGTVDNPYVVS